MPEGPEVTYIANKLNEELKNKKLISIKFEKGRYIKHGYPSRFTEFEKMLPSKLTKVDKKGKVIFFYFDNDWVMISKLGLMGWWYINDDRPKWRSEYKNIIFTFGNNINLIYSDTLSYGTITFCKLTDKEYKNEIDKLGMDIADNDTTFPKFLSKMKEEKNINKSIEDVLTNQELIISGIGNYLKSEILYEARIAPSRKIGDISDDELKNIFVASKKITKKFINALEKDHDGTRSYYDKQFKVYQQKEDANGNNIETYKTKSGRKTYWVPEIQK